MQRDVKYFIKLPGWFQIPTPVGSYNPDWAILRKNGDIVYMTLISDNKVQKQVYSKTSSRKIKQLPDHYLVRLRSDKKNKSAGKQIRICCQNYRGKMMLMD